MIDLDRLEKEAYRTEELEEMADAINDRFFPNRPKEASPIDPYLLIDKTGYETRWEYLSPNLKVKGTVFFENEYFYIWPSSHFEKGMKPDKILFPKNTVIINRALLEDEDNEETERFTAAHEACHIIKDSIYFRTHGYPVIPLFSGSEERRYWKQGMPTVDLIESQTNFLAGAVLMPKEQIKSAFFKSARFRNIPTKPIPFMPYMPKHIKKLAAAYGVSFNVVKYRLQDIGVLEGGIKEVFNSEFKK